MRKRIFAALTFALASTISTLSSAAPFTPGNVVVYRIGDGATTLGSVGHAVFIDEFTQAGTLVQTIALPTVGSGANLAFVASGTSTSDGLLTRSADGKCLLAPGYGRDLGTGAGNAAGTGTLASGAAIPRVVAFIAANGTSDTSTALTDAAVGSNLRSAASEDCTKAWVSGVNSGTGTAATAGIHYATRGATTSVDLTSATFNNPRALSVFNGQLYVSSAAGTSTFKGVNTVGAGLPVTGAQIVTRLAGLSDANNPSSYSFFLADLDAGVAGLDTLYIADDNGSTSNIQKYSFDGATWTARGAIGLSGARGITGIVTGSTVTLFVTNGTALQKLVDSSGFATNISGTLAPMASAGTNRVFRGVALAPSHPISVTSSSGSNGSITPATTQQFQLGLTATFTVTPD
ncbi:MAG: DUF3616 domain-containing protein, partial [Betaproteobacteria bacterium]|nr:DUF3616 domain-containing protein [Betaproteobacteria bacterium]